MNPQDILILTSFLATLPKHKQLSISHNTHFGYRESTKDYLSNRDDQFEDPDTNRLCIAANSVWEVRWYPNTPVGFYFSYGPTLHYCFEKIADAVKNGEIR